MLKNVILIEPRYKAKYPPLGLMKISTYFKQKGFNVEFSKGIPEITLFDAAKEYDIVCVSTLFTYDYDIVIKTINEAKALLKKDGRMFVGGNMATVMHDDVFRDTGIKPVLGILDKPKMLGFDDGIVIDDLVADYSIIPDCPKDVAYTSATKGCEKDCSFCIVKKIEPKYIDYKKILVPDNIKSLIMLDNNVLASKRFEEIARDIKNVGAKTVDFNQGIDYKLATKKNMSLLKDMGVKTVRFSIDDCESFEKYERAVKISIECGFKLFVTSMLYNFNDKPSDLYRRLKINSEIGQKHNISVNSFPMKYIPLTAKDRKHIGKHWNKKFIRSIQGMLCSARGLVSGKSNFFNHMWGNSEEEFLEILWMPFDMIVYRRKYSEKLRSEFPSIKKYHDENDLISEFLEKYRTLDNERVNKLHEIVSVLKYDDIGDSKIDDLLRYYRLNTPSYEIPWSKSYRGSVDRC